MNKRGTSQARLSAFHTGARFKAARRRQRRRQQPLTRSARCRPRGICTGYRIRNGGHSPEMRFLVTPKHSKKQTKQNKSRISVSDGCRQTAPVTLERNQRERPRLPGFDASFSCSFPAAPVLFFFPFSLRRSVSMKEDTSWNQQIDRSHSPRVVLNMTPRHVTRGSGDAEGKSLPTRPSFDPMTRFDFLPFFPI